MSGVESTSSSPALIETLTFKLLMRFIPELRLKKLYFLSEELPFLARNSRANWPAHLHCIQNYYFENQLTQFLILHSSLLEGRK